MKNNSQAIFYSSVVVLLLILAAIAGIFYGKTLNKQVVQNQQPVILNEEVEGQEIKTYTNEKLNFTLKYRSHLNLILEESNGIVFHTKTDDMTGFGVIIEKVPYNSTADWLAAQKKGSAKGPGYEGVLWVNGYLDGGNDLLLVDEYLQVDSDYGKPIYGKNFYGVQVKDGVLYKIMSKNEFHGDQISSADPEMMEIYSSFQLLK